MISLVSSVLFVLVCATTARAAVQVEDAGRSRILILDMAPESEGDAAANRIFSIDPSDDDPAIASLVNRLEGLAAGDSIANTAELITLIRSNSRLYARHSSTRWISRKGDSLHIYVLRPVNRKAQLDFAEEKRKSRIESDLITLLQVGQKIGQVGVLGEEPTPVRASFSVARYTLTKVRANFSITSTLAAPAPARTIRMTRGAAPGGQADDEDTAPPKLRTTLVTGPSEHLFISADAALTQARQVKYVESTRTLEPDKKPSEFLIGFNYSIGDLLQENETSSAGNFIRGIYAGFLIEASKRPFNQMAGVIGFRRNLPLLDRYVSFNTVSPYVGLVWLRNDKRESADSRVDSRYGDSDLIWGLSLNLDKALTWLGGTSSGASAVQSADR